MPISDVDWAGKYISEGSAGSGVETEQDIGRFIFRGNSFSLPSSSNFFGKGVAEREPVTRRREGGLAEV